MFFDENSCFFRHRFLHRFLIDFLSKNEPKWLQKTLPRSTILAPFFGYRFLDALWSPFGSLLAPFGLHFGRFWLHFGPFWLYFAPFWLHFETFWLLWLPFGTLLAPFWLLFLNFHSFSSLFLHLECFWFRFGRSSDAKTIFGAPNPARNPQQNYSRISTVGTPPFLGPGRVCCRRQLKIRPGP